MLMYLFDCTMKADLTKYDVTYIKYHFFNSDCCIIPHFSKDLLLIEINTIIPTHIKVDMVE